MTSPYFSFWELETNRLGADLQCSMGLINGVSVVNKFGLNADVDIATMPEDIWSGGGIYTGFPATVTGTISILSSNAADSSAGTGARAIKIFGLDASYNPQEEQISLNGISPVAGTLIFSRVNSAHVVLAGSGGFNAGSITVRHTLTPSNTFLSMATGRNQSNSSGFTIPAGFTGYLRRLMISCRILSGLNASGLMQGGLLTREFGKPSRIQRPFTISGNMEYVDEIYGGIVLPEKTDCIVRILSVTEDNSVVMAAYDLVLVKN